MAPHQLIFDAQGTPHAAHLIFEEAAERFHNLEVHLLWQSAHVVVGFYLCGWSVHRAGLDNIGVNGALCKITGVGYFLRFGVEYLNEGVADGFALLLRVGDALQGREEPLPGIH